MSRNSLRSVWRTILARCLNPHATTYYRYGACGISVCERWQGASGFDAFASDMGPRPPGTTVDRIDGTKGYSPDNCRWATPAEQARNTRSNKLTAELVREIVAGKYKSVPAKALAADIGVNAKHIRRVRRGDFWRDVVEAARKEAA